MLTQCFFLYGTGNNQLYLRRYASGKCGDNSCHDAMTEYVVFPITRDERGIQNRNPHPSHTDPRWPTHCKCGYAFKEEDNWQVFGDEIMRRSDTGELLPLRKAGPGAMWYADWQPDEWKGLDGHSLMVCLPNGRHWSVDSRASNCTRKDDKVHKCWCRHGEVPVITVDKVGDTCSAGAGSILAGNWHGFLRNGVLSEC